MTTDSYRVSELDYLQWKLRHEPEDLPGHCARALRFLALRGGANRRHDRGRARHFVHYSLHTTGDNAGDLTLAAVTPDVANHFLPDAWWTRRDVYAPVTAADIEELNRSAEGIFVGGGGLFVPDVNKGSPSGWQWPCATELLRRLRVPLVIFAIGYNRFRGQEDFPPVFRENLEQLARQCVVFGLRNPGSIRAVRGYLPAELHDRVKFQPCPTTVLRHYWPGMTPQSRARRDDVLVMNFVSDRAHLRFGDRGEAVRRGFAEIARWAGTQGWEVVVATHARVDAIILPDLRRAGAKCRVMHLERRFAPEVIDFYREATLTVGMRGHAQMIPFGCGNGVISLISHDKVKFFLESVEHPEWGVEVLEPDFVERAKGLITGFQQDRARVLAQVDAAQARLWEATSGNFAAVRAAVGITA